MLPLWIESLVTPCPHPLRAMGYLREVLNIKKSHGGWGQAWAPHFHHSQDVIRAAMARCAARRKAVILGSGMLYDIPIAELATAFEEVILVDVIHLLGTRWRLRRFANVRTLAADVTGTAEEVYRRASIPGTPLPRATPDLFCDDSEVDLVASVNLLSQLPYLPAQFLARTGVHSAEAIAAYARDVVRAHLDYLQRLPGTVALMADAECLTVNPAGRVIRRSSALYGIEIPWTGDSWTWRLVPRSQAYPHYSYQRRVVGIANVKEDSKKG